MNKSPASFHHGKQVSAFPRNRQAAIRWTWAAITEDAPETGRVGRLNKAMTARPILAPKIEVFPPTTDGYRILADNSFFRCTEGGQLRVTEIPS